MAGTGKLGQNCSVLSNQSAPRHKKFLSTDQATIDISFDIRIARLFLNRGATIRGVLFTLLQVLKHPFVGRVSGPASGIWSAACFPLPTRDVVVVKSK